MDSVNGTVVGLFGDEFVDGSASAAEDDSNKNSDDEDCDQEFNESEAITFHDRVPFWLVVPVPFDSHVRLRRLLLSALDWC